MIVQFLEDNGLQSSASILRDEASFKTSSDPTHDIDFEHLKTLLINGEWAQIEQMISEKSFSSRLLYALNRHHYVEILLSGDNYSALLFLSSKLRPLRAFEDIPGDFEQLTSTLIEAASPSCVTPLPEIDISLQRTLSIIDSQKATINEQSTTNGQLPENRLMHLMQQAAANQLMKYPIGKIRSMINDFEPAILPQRTDKHLTGIHSGNIKTINFIKNTDFLLSGGNDGKIVIWDVKELKPVGKLLGHDDRIWSLASNKNFCVSGSADGSIKLWDFEQMCQMSTFSNGPNDVYAVDIDSSSSKVISGGFDRTIILYDIETNKEIRTIKEHKGAVTSICFDSTGNLAISGGKDMTIHIWDLRDSIAVRTITPILGEISSVTSDREFTRILASTKNSTNKIWDLRTSDTSILLKGHHNTSKHFVRARFGCEERTVIGGSDDGYIYTWDSDTGILVEKHEAHSGGSYDIIYSKEHRIFASCGEDSIIRLWDEKQMNNI